MQMFIGRSFISLLALFLLPFVSVAAPRSGRVEIIDSLERKLSTVSTPADSIPYLYNIYDLSLNKDRLRTGNRLIATALRAGDDAAVLDVVRRNTVIFLKNDSVLNSLEAVIRHLPDSDDKRETHVFLRLYKLSHYANSADDDKRQEMISSSIRDYNHVRTSGDLLERIDRLFSLCIWLSSGVVGDSYAEYMNRLGEFIDELPQTDSGALRNLYLTQKALMAASNEHFEEGVNADRELLKMMADYKQKHKEEGRIYLDTSTNEYRSYARMLSNSDILSDEEVEEAYSRILELAMKSPDVRADLNSNDRATMWYLVAKGEYERVLPIMKRHMDLIDSPRYRRPFLKKLIRVANALHDQATLLSATTAYNEILEEQIRAQSESKFRELQTLYEVSDLREQKILLERDKYAAEHDANKIIVTVSIVGFIIVAVLLIILAMMYSRARQLNKNLKRSYEKVQSEKQSRQEAQQELSVARDRADTVLRLRETFVRNVRHELFTPMENIIGYSQLITDRLPDDLRSELDPYVKIISKNCYRFSKTVNDILDMSQIESGNLSLSLADTSVNELCREVAADAKPRLHEGVSIELDLPSKDTMFMTDRAIVIRMLNKLVDNAVKFTTKGTIKIGYETDLIDDTITFSVSDTGIGIKPEQRKYIFEPFVKASQFASGAGLGLYIVKMLATILGGEARLDIDYNEGARFVITLPLEEITRAH